MAVVSPQDLPLGSYYLLQDLLYRAVALTNSGGQVVEAYDTDAYGNTLIFTGPGADGIWFTADDVRSDYGANEIIYCGYRFDSETELYFVRNRTYDPVLGRWVQRDPIGYEGGINLYEYVGGGAAGGSDSTGLNDMWYFQHQMGVFAPQACCGKDKYDPRTDCCEKGKVVPMEPIWECVRRFANHNWIPVIPFLGHFETGHGYYCCDGPNKNCFGNPGAYPAGLGRGYPAAGTAILKGSLLPPELLKGGGCDAAEICPAAKRKKCNKPKASHRLGKWYECQWNCQDEAWCGGVRTIDIYDPPIFYLKR